MKPLLTLLLLVSGSHVSGFIFSSSTPAVSEKVTYELYTRKNNDLLGTGTGQVIGKDLDMIKKSNFNPNVPTKIFLHGWNGAAWNWYIRDMRREMLKLIDCNFIEVDWSAGSVRLNYVKAIPIAQEVGKNVADFLEWLHDNFGLQYGDVHLIGHSLGAQVAGVVGKHIQSPKVGRISGLDAAQPGFNLTDPSNTLGPEDADFVGIPFFTWVHEHLQSVYIYTETINNNNKCDFSAYQCSSYGDLLDGRCPTYCGSSKNLCNTMGYHASPNGAHGSLQIHIKESSPYC